MRPGFIKVFKFQNVLFFIFDNDRILYIYIYIYIYKSETDKK